MITVVIITTYAKNSVKSHTLMNLCVFTKKFDVVMMRGMKRMQMFFTLEMHGRDKNQITDELF